MAPNNTTPTPLTEDQRNAVLDALVDWELATPHKERTSAARAAMSRALAAEMGLSSLQVAGVRAHMTRGAYGTMKTLRARRRKALATA